MGLSVDEDMGSTDAPFAEGLLVELVRRLRPLKDGQLLALESRGAGVREGLPKWSGLTGNAIVEETAAASGRRRYIIRRGNLPTFGSGVTAAERRIWLYSNFHCNLACDYCCVRSSPTRKARPLSLDLIQAVLAEARDLGFGRALITGGEPLLRPDIAQLLRASTQALPTTVLTNGSLIDGPPGKDLEGLPRDRLTLQVSLDSPTATVHDRHRGPGSWARAVRGIERARARGFTVRVAATVESAAAASEMDRYLAGLGIAPSDRVLRPLAHRGNSARGWAVARAEIEPELTITDRGAYWHPLGAEDEDFLVSPQVLPLSDVVAKLEFLRAEDQRRGLPERSVFTCA